MLFYLTLVKILGHEKDKVPKKQTEVYKKNSKEKKEIIINENSSPVCFAKVKK